MEDQSCNRFDSELYKKAMEEVEARQRQDKEWLREMEKHSRCALLPSPDILDTAALEGEDVTNTLGDYADVLDWFRESGLLNTGFYQTADLETIKKKGKLSKERYGAMVQLAFDNAFAPILNTGGLESEELVVWYYAGHGLGKVNIQEVKKLREVSALPSLEKVGLNPENREKAAEYLPKRLTNAVKGGELCLHHVGFCDLYGILRDWIAALKGKSQNIREPEPHVKKNKHLVLILDSCYSGTFANDLNALAQSKGPWNKNGCAVTVQASCSADEPTFGGYFTPLFLFLNQNPVHLKAFQKEWAKLCEEQKKRFSDLPYPSPVVATTRNEGNDNLIKEIKCQNFRMVLFPDAGFFKYCFVRFFKMLNCKHSRTLDHDFVSKFLSQSSFAVLDFKLKKVSPGRRRYANTPLGLFLVDVPDENFVVCVHIHCPLNDTSNVSRINLVHHCRPCVSSTIYEEEELALKYQIRTGTPQANELVTACRDAVEENRSGRWSDHSQWNMTDDELGVNGLFRLQKQSEQRSQDMSKYLQNLDIYKTN